MEQYIFRAMIALIRDNMNKDEATIVSMTIDRTTFSEVKLYFNKSFQKYILIAKSKKNNELKKLLSIFSFRSIWEEYM